MRQMRERGVALLLAVCILVQTFIYAPKASAAAQASAANSFDLKGVNIACEQTLTDNGNGNYTLSITLDAGLNHSNINVESGVSQNNYFTAQYAGYYLVELWGGDGGDGDDTSVCAGGTGGAGGHVYGKVFLNKGETLYYQLGGDGVPTSAVDLGGGANGEGGGHGDYGSMQVGGGGGYSAIYKFAPAEFEQKYTDGNGNQKADISKADRASKYIMIAGGGGGGGAGDGWSIFGDDPVGTADGGAGGSMSSASGQLVGAGYAVEGTYYVGADGKSSGRDTSYVGHGGSNVPGAVSDTWTTLVKGKTPNDWEGAANPDMDGGSGGSGNMRGGAGGAGYCGGSGAVMTSIVSTYNIGGGGGGSSFVASSVAALTAEEQAKLGTDNSETGGTVHIEFLGSDEFTFIENLTLNVGMSQYMTLAGVTSSSGSWDGTSLTGMNLLDGSATVELKLKAANGFAGGNNVPLFGAGITCSTAEATPATAAINLGTDCSYVNVPFSNFDVDVQNHTTNKKDKEYLLSSLYLGKYAGFDPAAPFGNAADAWKYAFIESVDAYTVNGNAVGAEDSVTVAETTEFEVAIKVYPKNTGVAAVGEQVTARTFTQKAIIMILGAGETDLNGNAVKYYKDLKHDGTNYILTLHTEISSDLTASAASQSVVAAGPLDEYVIETPGYYYIQAWGGNGGAGGSKNGGNGGNGGTGGYVSGYIKLEEGDSLSGNVAKNGTAGNAAERANQVVATGGGASKIVLNGATTLLIAGGGGGGGNGGNGDWNASAQDGDSGTSATTNLPTASLGEDADYIGGPGKEAEYSWLVIAYRCTNGGGGGDAGANFRSETMKTDPAQDNTLSQDQKTRFATKIQNIPSNKPDGAAAGAIVITPLELESTEQADIADYTINTQLSDYFVLADTPQNAISFGDDSETGTDGGVLTTGEGHAVEYIYNSIENSGNNMVTINDIDPVVSEETTTTTVNGEVTTHTVKHAWFSVSYALQPRDDFLGGNDVPVIVATDSNDDEDKGMSMQYTQLGQKRNIAGNDQADNANVPIPADNAWANEAFIQITEPAPTIVKGETVQRNPGLYTMADGAPSFDGSGWKTDALWQNDFVQPQIQLTNAETGAVVEGDLLAPTETTKYIVSAGLSPVTTGDDVKAICLRPVDAAIRSQNAIIYVLPRIIYQLSNLETDDSNGIWDGDDYTVTVEADKEYTAKLTPKDGYKLPGSITVLKNNAVVAEGYTYDSATGVITLDADLVGLNAVTIRADGGEAEYTITYAYEVAPGIPFIPTLGNPYPTNSYKEGVTIPADAFYKTYTPNMSFSNSQHYDFIWTWEVEGGAEPTVMPAKDIWAVGQYVPKEYTLVVQYLEEGTNNVLAPENTETKVRYGKDYEVYPVSVTGYKPAETVITGTMVDDAAGNIVDGKKTVTFYYKAIAGKLDITYIYGDTHETISSTSQDIKYGDSYSVTTPAIDGYTPDIAVVEGTVSEADATNGISITVTYNPNVYTVTFDPNGGTVSESIREVLFNGTYDYYRYYDAEKAEYAFAYNALPKPVRSGDSTVEYEFLGWYLGDTKISDSDDVTTAGNHTLVAKWEEVIPEYVLTIKYVYENGSTAAEPVSRKVPYGGTYEVASPVIADYTPDMAVVAGTMGAMNRLVTVTYVSDYHTLTVYYLYGPDEGAQSGQKFKDPDVYTIHNGDSRTLTFEKVTKEGVEYTPSMDEITVTMGTTDQSMTIYYTHTGPVVSVTVTWGQLDFVYDYGTWVPESHTYSVEPIEPVARSTNKVTVTNNAESNIPINAKLSYAVDANFDAYADIDGYFTTTDNRVGEVTAETGTLQPTESKTAYFWLNGTMEDGKTGTLTSGTCTVTITGGG